MISEGVMYFALLMVGVIAIVGFFAIDCVGGYGGGR